MTSSDLVRSVVVQSLRVKELGVTGIDVTLGAASMVEPNSKDAGSVCVKGDNNIAGEIEKQVT